MTTHDQSRSETADAIIADARAMLEAAQADDAVAHRLGRPYLARTQTLLDQATAAIHASGAAAHAQYSEHDHVTEVATQLAVVMREIRDAVELDEQPARVQQAFGRGADWAADQPDKLATSAAGLAEAIHDHPDVVRHAAIDLQHRHDLAHLAQALSALAKSHRALRADHADATQARTHALTALSAAAHHIRLAARLLHRREPAKLARFVSPVPHHRVAHHTTAAPPTPSTAKS